MANPGFDWRRFMAPWDDRHFEHFWVVDATKDDWDEATAIIVIDSECSEQPGRDKMLANLCLKN